jgi:hypothetical protein
MIGEVSWELKRKKEDSVDLSVFNSLMHIKLGKASFQHVFF